MTSSILFAVLLVAISAGGAYFISNWFWSTEYSRTNKSGDGGGPFGGVWASASGMLIALVLGFHVFKYVIEPDILGPATITAMVLGVVAGFIPLFRRRK